MMRLPKVKEYPRRLLIGDSHWELKFKRLIIDNGTKCVGLCDPGDQEILISQGLTSDDRLKTFIHEVLHAMEIEGDFNLDHKHVYKLEELIFSFLINNRWG